MLLKGTAHDEEEKGSPQPRVQKMWENQGKKKKKEPKLGSAPLVKLKRKQRDKPGRAVQRNRKGRVSWDMEKRGSLGKANKTGGKNRDKVKHNGGVPWGWSRIGTRKTGLRERTESETISRKHGREKEILSSAEVKVKGRN